jgi:hypothetical protein
MFLRYSIKISSWLLLTVASFNFDRYPFSNDLFILLFYKRWSSRIPQTTKVSIHNLPFFFQFTKIDTHKNNWIHSNRIYYNKWCVITNVVYVRTEMCTNNKFVSTLIWKRCFHTDMKMSRSIILINFFLIYGVLMPLSTIFLLYHGDQFVCQTNMHLIMWIENAFKFCGELIHFYKERISFLFYCEDGKREAVSWLSLNLWKSSRPFIYLMSAGFGCSSDSSMVSWGFCPHHCRDDHGVACKYFLHPLLSC